MTYLEKLKIERPDRVDPHFVGGAKCCPWIYGYEDDCPGKIDCKDCWEREMPEKKVRK